MQDFTRLRVWQRARQLAVEMQRETEAIEDSALTAITSRLLHAVDGIAANIAQGTAQPTPALFARSLLQAIACASEVIASLAVARERGAIPATRYVMLDMETQEVRRMLHALRGKVIEKIRMARSGTR